MSQKTKLAEAYYAISKSIDIAREIKKELLKDIENASYQKDFVNALIKYTNKAHEARDMLKTFL